MAANIRLTDKVNNVNEEDELRKRGYIVGVTLGEGSYAKVKSAYYEKNDRKVALKIINRKKAPKDFQTRFLPRELDILRRIKHPNIILLIDIMHFNHKVYIAMEMAGHGDLLEYIKLRGAIPEDKAKKMFQQLADAIEYLHSMNVIHRDLKCENILLDGKNNLKLSDFGFARVMRKDDVSKTFCGSAAYAAPEILQGIPYSGLGYDIWSIGVILYIMVCGSMPYDDSNIKRMIKYQTERKVPFSRSKRVSETCKHLIHRMLDADRQTRASISEVQSHAWLDGQRRHHQVQAAEEDQKSFLTSTQNNILSFTPAALLAQYVTNFWHRDSSTASARAPVTAAVTDTRPMTHSERRYNDAWTNPERKRQYDTTRERRQERQDRSKAERSMYT